MHSLATMGCIKAGNIEITTSASPISLSLCSRSLILNDVASPLGLPFMRDLARERLISATLTIQLYFFECLSKYDIRQPEDRPAPMIKIFFIRLSVSLFALIKI